MNLLRPALQVSLNLRRAASSSYRSINLCYAFKPEVLPETEEGNWRNNKLPREYERMMQKVMFRVGPTTVGTKRLHRMCMGKRETKFSEAARMSTPQGREILYRRLIDGRHTLWPFGK
ncbi:hypothetical protein SprV_0100471200 [Sparganum proliferum]